MALDHDSAVRIISNISGFSDGDTMAGEAWQAVQSHVKELEAENERLRELSRGRRVSKNRALKMATGYRLENQRLREALEIIAGERPCLDDLMSDKDVARAALYHNPKVGA